MKLIIYHISLLLIFTSLSGRVSGQESREDKFSKGTEYYTSGDFEGALELWSDIYNTGYRSAELNYNIGNAYFKMNNIPGAILYYERALLLKPADEDIKYNLEIARTMVVDRFDEIPELFFVKWYNFMSLLRSSDKWSLTSITAFILCLVFLSVYLYSGRYRLKIACFWLALFLFIISASSLAFSVRNKDLVLGKNQAVVMSPVVNGKSSPDNSGTDLFVLHEGTKVSVEDEVGEWFGIRLSDGNKGWIPASSVEIL